MREINLTACRLLGMNGRTCWSGRSSVCWRRRIAGAFSSTCGSAATAPTGGDRAQLATRDGRGRADPAILPRPCERGAVQFRTALIDLRGRLRLERERLDTRMEVTQLRHDEQIARHDKEAKDRWLAVLSHELRTPLTPVVFAITNLMRLRNLPTRRGGC